jgi:hypothetical protein
MFNGVFNPYKKNVLPMFSPTQLAVAAMIAAVAVGSRVTGSG